MLFRVGPSRNNSGLPGWRAHGQARDADRAPPGRPRPDSESGGTLQSLTVLRGSPKAVAAGLGRDFKLHSESGLGSDLCFDNNLNLAFFLRVSNYRCCHVCT